MELCLTMDYAMKAVKTSVVGQPLSVEPQPLDTLYAITWQAENSTLSKPALKRSLYGVNWNIKKGEKRILHTRNFNLELNRDKILLWPVSASSILHDVATVQHIAKHKHEYDHIGLTTCGALSLPLVQEGPGELDTLLNLCQ